jgi:chromosome segregation ATPase
MGYNTYIWTSMILKLYNLNKSQLEQNLMKKQQVVNQIHNLNSKIDELNDSILKMSVNKLGAIGDFKLLAIHKNTMNYEKEKLKVRKITLQNEMNKIDNIINNFQKEIEKYSYLLKKEKKEKIKELEKYDENIAFEYIQSQFSSKSRSKLV